MKLTHIAAALRQATPCQQWQAGPKVSEMLAVARASRVALLDKMDALIKAIEGAPEQPAIGNTAAVPAVEARAFTADEGKAYDAVAKELADLDAHIARLEARYLADAQTATPLVTSHLGQRMTPLITLTPPKLNKGEMFGLYAMAMYHARGNFNEAMRMAEQWKDSMPEIGGAIERAAVLAGTTTGTTWAAPLVNQTILQDEFMGILMPETVTGQIEGKRTIPFNVKIPRMTGGVTAQWVGEGQSKPVGIGAFDLVQHPWAKLAIITVMTEEVVRFSNPSAPALMTQNMKDAIVIEYNNQFLNGGAPVVGLKPGGIFDNLLPALIIPSTGATLAAINADLNKLLTQQAMTGVPLTNPYWIMSTRTAGYISGMRTALDTPAYPTMNGKGGSLLGIPVIVSTQVPTNLGVGTNESYIGLVSGGEIFWSQDPQVSVDMSREASLQMDSAPATPPTPLVSLWQQNLVGIKAEQFIYWSKRRQGAFGRVTGVTY